jgi:hypothetical protein
VKRHNERYLTNIVSFTYWAGEISSELRPRHFAKAAKEENAMSQLYELDTSSKSINELLDIDGDIDFRKLMDCGPDGLEKTTDYMLDIYDRTAWGVLRCEPHAY